MSCSSKRNRLLGSCSSTLVSSTNSLAGPVPRALRARGAGAGAAGRGVACTSGTAGAVAAKLAGSTVLASRGPPGALVLTLARVPRGGRAGVVWGAGGVVAVVLRGALRRVVGSASGGGGACTRKASG